MNTIDRKLARFNISQEQFVITLTDLIISGFSQRQANQIIDVCLYSFNNDLNDVTHFLKRFSRDLRPYFSNKELITVIKQKACLLKLEALVNYSKRLIETGFNAPDLLKITIKDGGHKNIQAIYDHFNTLHDDLGFSHDLIIAMVNCSGGSNNLLSILKRGRKLLNNGFDHNQIAKIAKKHNAPKNIEAIACDLDWLKERFNPEQVAKLGKRAGGSYKLKTLKTHFTTLQEMGYSQEQIIKIANHHNIKSRISSIISITPTLKKFGLECATIVHMLSNKQFPYLFNAINKKYANLLDLYTEEQIKTDFWRLLGPVINPKKLTACMVLKHLDS